MLIKKQHAICYINANCCRDFWINGCENSVRADSEHYSNILLGKYNSTEEAQEVLESLIAAYVNNEKIFIMPSKEVLNEEKVQD